MYRSVVVVLVAAVLSVSGAVGLTRSGPDAGPPAASEGRPATAGAVVGVAGQVGALQERLRRLPEDAAGWAGLALAYVEQARVTGDPSYYDRADDALARSFAIAPEQNPDAEAAAAALAAARHDFSAALERADAALRIAPHQPSALVLRVDALTELGRYPEQLRALAVADRRQPGVPVASRYAYARELRGDLAGAADVLVRSLGSAAGSDRVFLLTLVADVERRLGRLDRATGHLDQALREDPSFVPARAGLARLAVARGDLGRATKLWEAVAETMPLPEYLTELGELYRHRGLEERAELQFDIVATTTELFADSGVNADLEAALFEADHGDPATALRIARAEYSRRQSVHTADVLAWALHRTARDRAALALAREATRLGTAEARFWLHRGHVERALGLDAAARRHLRRGLATDPGVSPLQAAQARTALAALEDGGLR